MRGKDSNLCKCLSAGRGSGEVGRAVYDALFLQDWRPGCALAACRITGSRTFAQGHLQGGFYCWLKEAGDRLLLCGVFVHVWCAAYICVCLVYVYVLCGIGA